MKIFSVKIFLRYFLLICCCQTSIPSFAQTANIDSLKKILSENIKEKNKIKAGESLHQIGKYFHLRSQYDSALYYYRQALLWRSKISDTSGIAASANNMAILFRKMGKYDECLSYYLLALRNTELLKDTPNIAIYTGNIGTLYFSMGNFSQSILNLERALDFYKNKNEANIGMLLNNLGLAYDGTKNYKNAMECFLKANDIFEKTSNLDGKASVMNNIGTLYEKNNEFEKALDYYRKALSANEELNDLDGVALSFNNLGSIYHNLGNAAKSTEYYNKGMSIANENHLWQRQREIYEGIQQVYAQAGKFEDAYFYYKKYSEIKDSLLNEASSRQIAEMQTKYETEKKEKEIEMLNVDKEKQAAISAAESKKQKTIILAVTFGLLLVIVFATFMWRRWKITQRQKKIIEYAHGEIVVQKKIIEEQKKIVEEKNKDITDSIEYASRIQQAILPEQKEFDEMFPDSFILYKPKDIVAGDFYWISQTNGSRYLLTADCTGHGVPGAFMSMIGAALYNEAINEKKIFQPNIIFNEVRKGIIKALKQKEHENSQKDGMDAVLCRFMKNENGTFTMECSCANNSLIILKNSGEAVEIAADHFPVGTLGEIEKLFTLHTIKINKNDIVYSFTDGYHDQFGGPKGKKFKYAKFKELILSLQKKTMSEQREILHQTIEKWRGDLEQIDDICIIGVRV